MKNLKCLFLWGILTFLVIPHSIESFEFDQMQNIQQELEEANRAIEEYIASLPPEEQAEFNRMVDEVSQMFDNMSEEEFSTFLNEMFTEEPTGMPTETYTPAAQPVFEAAPELTSEQKKKVDNIIKIINDIIRQSNIFLVQVSSSLEAEKNINSWSKKGNIANWQPQATWIDFKLEIEKFVQQLHKMEDKDLNAGEYKYLVDLIADEATLNNLIQLQTNLNSSVPHIEISELDIQGLSSQAKNAIKNTLQYYTEALYMLQIPNAFEAIFEKFTPKAEKYREAEEAAEKKAAEAAKRQRTPVSATTAGTPEEAGYGYGYDYGSYGGYDYGGYGGGYGSDYGSYGGYDYGGYGGGYGGGFGEETGKRGGGGGGSRMGGGDGGASEAKESKRTSQVPGVGVTTEPKKDPYIKKLIKNIATNIDDVAKIIKNNSLFETLDKHIAGGETTDPVNSDLANEIAEVYKKTKDITEEIETLQSKILKTDTVTQAKYSNEFAASIEESMKLITNLKNTLTKIKFKELKATPLKQWAYLKADDRVLEPTKKGEVNAPGKIEELKEKVTTRVSLKDLLDSLEKLDGTINTLKEKTKASTSTTTIVMPPASPAAPVETTSEISE